MATSRNQPQYDFLTGRSSPSADQFREHTRGPEVIADAGNENLRALNYKLQYEIESLKQERELSTLRHSEELRVAQSKADTEYKRAQTLELGSTSAISKHDIVVAELREAQEKLIDERNEFERKLRLSQDRATSLEENLEDAKTDLVSQERQHTHDLNELKEANDSHQRTVENLQTELEQQSVAVKKAQQQVHEKDAQMGIFENEIMRLKAQTGDVETLAIIKEDLSRQVMHIQKLEASNLSQRTELKQYRKQQKAVDVVEEEKRMLETKLRVMNDLRKELSEVQVRKQILEDERQSWSIYLKKASANEDDPQFDSPEDLAKAYFQERLEKVELTDKLGRVAPELSAKDVVIRRLETEKFELLEAAKKTKNAGSSNDAKSRSRLERQRALAIKEVEYLRAQVKAFDTEEVEFNPERHDEQKTERINELETLVDQLRSELQTLHSDMCQIETSSTLQDCEVPTLGAKRARNPADDGDERVGELSRKYRALQTEASQMQTQRTFLEKELEIVKEQLENFKVSSRTRILQFRDNPTSSLEIIKMSSIKTLHEENQALLARLEGSHPDIKMIPFSTLERIRLDIADKERALFESQKQNQRLKEVFTKKINEFRKSVESVLGWTLDFMPNGLVRVTSIFYPGVRDDELGESGNSILFDGQKGTMKVSGGPQSAFAGEIRDLIEYWVEGRKEIPCFLAGLTMEFYEKSTRAEKI